MSKVIINCGEGVTDTSFTSLLTKVDVLALTTNHDNYELFKDCGYEVYAGAHKGLMQPRTVNDNYQPKTAKKAWDVILDSEEEIEIVNVGTLTNIAIAIIRRPEIKDKIKRIIMVGGSGKSGDVTAFAEKSVYDDAYSAAVVFQSEIPVVMFGLDSYQKMGVNKEELAVAALVDDKFYTTQNVFVGVETNSALTYGMTVCDYYGKELQKENAEVVTNIDIEKYNEVLASLKGGK